MWILLFLNIFYFGWYFNNIFNTTVYGSETMYDAHRRRTDVCCVLFCCSRLHIINLLRCALSFKNQKRIRQMKIIYVKNIEMRRCRMDETGGKIGFFFWFRHNSRCGGTKILLNPPNSRIWSHNNEYSECRTPETISIFSIANYFFWRLLCIQPTFIYVWRLRWRWWRQRQVWVKIMFFCYFRAFPIFLTSYGLNLLLRFQFS